MNGKTITLDVDYWGSIKQIKDKISEVANIPATIQMLIFWGKILKEHSLLSETNLSKESTIHVIAYVGHKYTNKFLIPWGNRIAEMIIKVSYHSIIEDIKFEIQDETGFPWESIHLYYNNEELNDKDILIERVD